MRPKHYNTSPAKHSESRPDGTAAELYKAMLEVLERKYAVEQDRIRRPGLDPRTVEADDADEAK